MLDKSILVERTSPLLASTDGRIDVVLDTDTYNEIDD